MTKRKKATKDKKITKVKKEVWRPPLLLSLSGIFVFALILYANTLGHDFALDDAIVITDNAFTQKGFGGLIDIFSKDTFHGFFGEAGKDKLVSGGRYRPFTLAMFAIERAIAGEGAFFHHLINVLLYGLTGIVVFLLGTSLFKKKFDPKVSFLLALGMAALFLSHPLHTEAVANIKGRDEIVAFLGSIGAMLIFTRKQFRNLVWKDYLYAGLLLFIGLLSKENAITFIAVIPLAALIFFDVKLIDQKGVIVLLLLVSSLFIGLRTAVIGFDLGAAPSGELMNNPYLKVEGNLYIPFTSGEKLATISYTLSQYLKLLFIPHPLTHDYYPNHVSLKTFSSPGALLGILSYLILGFLSIWGMWNKKLWSFFTSYFLITISIVSNIVFPIGTHMSERFLYMPSLAFSGILSYLLFKYLRGKKSKIAIGLISIIVLFFSVLTINRNSVWKDNFTLFTTDALTSQKSAKVNNAAAGAIGEKLKEIEEGSEKNELIRRSHMHTNNAITAHPNYVNAYLIKGNTYFYENKFPEAIRQYEQCLRIDPSYEEASRNIFIAYRGAGRYFGEKRNDLPTSLEYLRKALAFEPEDFETNRLLGTCYGIMGNHGLAINHFKKCTDLQPNNAGAFVNLGKAYEFIGDNANAQSANARAKNLDPNIFNK